ncbi:DNA repair protein XRCC2 homolog isoform X2 [Typha latifolia]|uniref:DNA repair protein XRCC2 homolog isoform X2 n=1 Tax=Typha latifolia TaxID=4733 RepID=UPI003C2DD2FF
MAEDPRAWIQGDESAKEMLSRVLSERPFVLLPPLHRVPLRVGNVVEISGPSNSAKTQVLLQAVVHCILPKEWKGIHFGGLEKMVMYFDLDCRFDVLRLSQILRHRITETCGSVHDTYWGTNEGPGRKDIKVARDHPFDDELLLACMRRFLYNRCYSSSEFLAALKKMRCLSQRESAALGVGIHFLMIDSIGALYWMDRLRQSMSVSENTRSSYRKNISLQSLAEIMVEEIRKLLQLQPVLVLATKPPVFGAGPSTNDLCRTAGKWVDETDFRTPNREAEKKISFREYMPSVWQSFVTHRVYLQASEGHTSNREKEPYSIYTSAWMQPPLSLKDKFSVRDDGIFLIT